MAGAYYNENDPFAAAWLRELVKARLIAGGEVDERTIEDVQPGDLKGFTQCHFFAGIGGWSYALRNAGWSDDLECWTGSCPCQSFSAAGKGEGFSDKRHLWPAWFRLISECQPHTVFGEQVASKDGLAWLDVVSADLEGKSYAIGTADLCAAGFGAPHIRQRLFFVADSERNGRWTNEQEREAEKRVVDGWNGSTVADARRQQNDERKGYRGSSQQGGNESTNGLLSGSGCQLCGSTNGFWREVDWLACRDGKHRPVEPGIAPLVNGATNRVGRLRGYGNAICAPVAQAFIESYMSI